MTGRHEEVEREESRRRSIREGKKPMRPATGRNAANIQVATGSNEPSDSTRPTASAAENGVANEPVEVTLIDIMIAGSAVPSPVNFASSSSAKPPTPPTPEFMRMLERDLSGELFKHDGGPSSSTSSERRYYRHVQYIRQCQGEVISEKTIVEVKTLHNRDQENQSNVASSKDSDSIRSSATSRVIIKPKVDPPPDLFPTLEGEFSPKDHQDFHRRYENAAHISSYGCRPDGPLRCANPDSSSSFGAVINPSITPQLLNPSTRTHSSAVPPPATTRILPGHSCVPSSAVRKPHSDGRSQQQPPTTDYFSLQCPNLLPQPAPADAAHHPRYVDLVNMRLRLHRSGQVTRSDNGAVLLPVSLSLLAARMTDYCVSRLQAVVSYHQNLGHFHHRLYFSTRNRTTKASDDLFKQERLSHFASDNNRSANLPLHITGHLAQRRHANPSLSPHPPPRRTFPTPPPVNSPPRVPLTNSYRSQTHSGRTRFLTLTRRERRERRRLRKKNIARRWEGIEGLIGGVGSTRVGREGGLIGKVVRWVAGREAVLERRGYREF